MAQAAGPAPGPRARFSVRRVCAGLMADPTAAVQVVSLWGSDHPELGTVAQATLDPYTGIALSRGRFPKAYAHVDANEDAVLAAGGPAGLLLAVADGHNGFDAARAALASVSQGAGWLLATPAADTAQLVQSLLSDGVRAVRRRVAELSTPRNASRTALSLALIRHDRVLAATFGDTLVARVRGRRLTFIGNPGPFLGAHATLPKLSARSLKPGDCVLVASDGLWDYLGPAGRSAVTGAIGRTPPPEGVAALVAWAFARGAGDNVAVAGTQLP